MIDCEAMEHINPLNLPFNLPNKECCIAYEIDWAQRPIIDLFCSGFVDKPFCKIDIKILQATITKQCYLSSLHRLIRIVKSKDRIKDWCN